jgi:hypothetical protein
MRSKVVLLVSVASAWARIRAVKLWRDKPVLCSKTLMSGSIKSQSASSCSDSSEPFGGAYVSADGRASFPHSDEGEDLRFFSSEYENRVGRRAYFAFSGSLTHMA